MSEYAEKSKYIWNKFNVSVKRTCDVDEYYDFDLPIEKACVKLTKCDWKNGYIEYYGNSPGVPPIPPPKEEESDNKSNSVLLLFPNLVFTKAWTHLDGKV